MNVGVDKTLYVIAQGLQAVTWNTAGFRPVSESGRTLKWILERKAKNWPRRLCLLSHLANVEVYPLVAHPVLPFREVLSWPV